ncbi:hypothetical protein [Agrococcus sp. Marseille-Q4369]|uniref:hypothetical protein n=1 Tax=Agrococcus sp. Marseille-Q4369 TaxID=2810513 RepID=UPI001B8D166B|nr:hypothetical protein [Agrococcus sp. Marseille-Q4369]QUW20247.1 hypothetical protein JSQ78_11880 [Agrococcus sp. Marseille-Q4369]
MRAAPRDERQGSPERRLLEHGAYEFALPLELQRCPAGVGRRIVASSRRPRRGTRRLLEPDLRRRRGDGSDRESDGQHCRRERRGELGRDRAELAAPRATAR